MLGEPLGWWRGHVLHLGMLLVFLFGERHDKLPALSGAWGKKGLWSRSRPQCQQLATWATWRGRLCES